MRTGRTGSDIFAVSIAAWVVVLGNTWEFGVVTSTFSIANGGTAGAIWINIIVCIGMFLTVLSMAEVASMAPTAGGEALQSLPRTLSFCVLTTE